MKKGSRSLIGFAVAAVTFGTLMATLGPQKFGNCHGRWNHNYGHCGHTCYHQQNHAHEFEKVQER